MGDSVTDSLILLGVLGAVLLAMFLVAFGRPGDDPGDPDTSD